MLQVRKNKCSSLPYKSKKSEPKKTRDFTNFLRILDTYTIIFLLHLFPATLIKYKAEIDSRNVSNKTPTDMAADLYNFEFVRFLMENGASCCAHYLGPDIPPEEFPDSSKSTNLSPEFEMLGLANPEFGGSETDVNTNEKIDNEIEIPPGVEPEPSKSSQKKNSTTIINRKPRRRHPARTG